MSYENWGKKKKIKPNNWNGCGPHEKWVMSDENWVMSNENHSNQTWPKLWPYGSSGVECNKRNGTEHSAYISFSHIVVARFCGCWYIVLLLCWFLFSLFFNFCIKILFHNKIHLNLNIWPLNTHLFHLKKNTTLRHMRFQYFEKTGTCSRKMSEL